MEQITKIKKDIDIKSKIYNMFNYHCENTCCSDCDYNVVSCESDFYDDNIEEVRLQLQGGDQD